MTPMIFFTGGQKVGNLRAVILSFSLGGRGSPVISRLQPQAAHTACGVVVPVIELKEADSRSRRSTRFRSNLSGTQDEPNRQHGQHRDRKIHLKVKNEGGYDSVLYPQISYECEVRTQTFDIIYQEMWKKLLGKALKT